MTTLMFKLCIYYRNFPGRQLKIRLQHFKCDEEKYLSPAVVFVLHKILNFEVMKIFQMSFSANGALHRSWCYMICIEVHYSPKEGNKQELFQHKPQ